MPEPWTPVIELSKPGVIWLGAEPVLLKFTGAERAQASLEVSAEEDSVVHDVVATGFGQSCFPLSADPSGTLKVGGKTEKKVLGAIDRWYRREARQRIGLCVEVESERLGLRAEKLSIRDQKTRWGSCSTSGTLSFNWRLVIGPHHALRYVVIHELIHIRHHNHSRAFWSDLTAALPDWRESATWLRANERRLTRYKPRLR